MLEILIIFQCIFSILLLLLLFLKLLIIFQIQSDLAVESYFPPFLLKLKKEKSSCLTMHVGYKRKYK